MSNDIEDFLATRDQLSKEYEGIGLRIDELQAELNDLKARKRLLDKAFGVPVKKTARKKPAAKKAAPRGGSTPKDDPNVERPVELLKGSPTMGRDEIATHFPKLDSKGLGLLLSKCKKRGLIDNAGGKRHPAWFAVEQA